MTKRTGAIGIAVLIGLLMLGACKEAEQAGAGRATAALTPLIASSEVDLDGLERIAERACLCTRSGDEKSSCWREFANAKAGIEAKIFGNQVRPDGQFGYGSACAPVSIESECFPFADGEHCVVTGYDPNGASQAYRDVLVCTRGEAQEIERASAAPFYIDGIRIDGTDQAAWDQANDQSQHGIDRVMAKIRRGDTFKESETLANGCV